MAKFMFLYKGPASDMNDLSEDQVNAIMDGWNRWMDKVGDALVDVGHPMDNSASVVDDGSRGTAEQISGYSIVQADDLQSAIKLSDKHPFLSDGKGQFAIDIFELLPVPM